MIQITDLTKKYEGQTVLDTLSLRVEAGQVYCLLGKNGVGKTTLIRLILDLIQADHGQITVFGKPNTALTKVDKQNLGCVLDDLGLIEELNALDYLSWVGAIYGMPKETILKRRDDMLNYFFEDQSSLKKSIAKYSTGMKKKISFCAAVLHTPSILILDEPFSGLDPFVANQMVAFLQKYQRPDRTLFISSHDLTYVEKIATHIGVLDNQQLVFSDTREAFTDAGAHALDSALLQLIKPNESEISKLDWV